MVQYVKNLTDGNYIEDRHGNIPPQNFLTESKSNSFTVSFFLYTIGLIIDNIVELIINSLTCSSILIFLRLLSKYPMRLVTKLMIFFFHRNKRFLCRHNFIFGSLGTMKTCEKWFSLIAGIWKKEKKATGNLSKFLGNLKL